MATTRGVEKLDLMIGTLSEGHRPTHFGFGETMFQIFILNATRRLQADRFYTDNYNEETYTREGLDWIDTPNFKTVLLRNLSGARPDGTGQRSNAFEPWDTDGPWIPSGTRCGSTTRISSRIPGWGDAAWISGPPIMPCRPLV